MKAILRVFLTVLLLGAAVFAAEEGRFFTYPTIHNDKIAFTYESDLWVVSAQGGTATRLTTFPGTENFAKFSPDGKWIAFTATYDGAPAAYLMPADGGAPVRLTYNPGGAQVVAWTPDGTEVVFRSMFENAVGRDPNLYSVKVKGGAPERLPLDRGVLVSFMPEEHKFLYCRRGNEEYYWKRYKGGQYQDIWLCDAVAKTYTPVTDYVGKNSYPMWAGGLMYFISDRGSGIANLFTQKLGTKEVKAVTSYADFDVMMPHTDGRSIVYAQDGRIHVYDVQAGRDRKIAVKEGDFLVAINGTPLKAGDDYFKLLQTTAGKKIKITVNARPTTEGAKTFEVEPIRSDNAMRYFRWIQDNIKAIEKATDGRVGYMHINAMGGGGIGEFDKYWRAFRYKDGVILDLRRNSGGWTEYFLIDKLERELVAYNNLRGMVPFRYPGSAGNGNYVVISNENNGSDGEAFVEHFKARKLGPVVGVPSWGGLVGILNQQLTIDNGTVEQSNNAFYGKEGTWWVENHGADPDVLIDNDPGSVMAGRDLQLEKAIEVVLDKIKKNPSKFVPKPAYPKK